MNILFFDTETTGLPEWKIPSGDKKQPHLVQLAAILCNLKTEEVIKTMDVIIKPDGWEISQEMTDIHGISQKQAMSEGILESDAIAHFLSMWGNDLDDLGDCKFSKRVAHNRTFDQRIIRIGLKRYFSDDIQDRWAWKDDFECTMLKSKPILQLLPKRRFGYKNPRLEEAYKFFMSKEIQNAHNAIADTEACKDIYFAMRDWNKCPGCTNWSKKKDELCETCKKEVPF